MSKYESRQELAEHIDQEGLYYFFANYGIDAGDAPDEETKAAVEKVLDTLAPFKTALDALLDLIDF